MALAQRLRLEMVVVSVSDAFFEFELAHVVVVSQALQEGRPSQQQEHAAADQDHGAEHQAASSSEKRDQQHHRGAEARARRWWWWRRSSGRLLADDACRHNVVEAREVTLQIRIASPVDQVLRRSSPRSVRDGWLTAVTSGRQRLKHTCSGMLLHRGEMARTISIPWLTTANGT